MKTREQFIDTVLERAERAKAAERARRKRFRVITGTVAAAACLTVTVGLSGVLDGMMMVGSDGAEGELAPGLNVASQYGRATEGDQEVYDVIDDSDIADGDTAGNSGLDGAATEPNMGTVKGDVKAGSTADGFDGAPADAGDALKIFDDTDSSNAEDVTGYWCLPAEIRIMNRDGNEIGCAEDALTYTFEQVTQMEKEGTAVRLGQTETGGKLDEATLRKAENWTNDAKYVQKVTYIYSYEDPSRNPVWLLLEPIE